MTRLPPLQNVRPVTKSASPAATIADHAELVLTFDVDESFRAGDVRLDLDIDHASRSDLVVTLTSPSGKRTVISDRDSLPRPDLKGTFDVTSAFDREPVQGEWKLTVADEGTGDTGTLNSWALHLGEGEARPIPAGSGAADDTSKSAGLVRLMTSKRADGRFQLLDKSRGQGIETRDAMDSRSNATFKPFTDDNDAWGESTDSPRQAAAIEAHYALQMGYDFLRDVLGRDSVDGQGGKLVANMHLPTPRGAAMTNWHDGQLWFVDGVVQTLTSLDVVGSELARGLIEHTARLEGWGEQYAVASAMSQIVGGAGVEWYAMQRNETLARTGNPYLVESSRDDVPAMNMADPKSDGQSIDHMSEFQSGSPHLADGIIANAFYLLTHGGTNSTSHVSVAEPIGMENGLKIFWDALAHRLPPTATIAQTRQATVEAASELFGAGSTEAHKVEEAWSAVGVG